MPVKYQLFLGIYLTAAVALGAEAPQEAVKYQECMMKARSEAEQKIRSECAGLKAEGAVSACMDRFSVGQATINYCKLVSNVILSSNVNNRAEADIQAEKQKAYEEKFGIHDGEEPEILGTSSGADLNDKTTSVWASDPSAKTMRVKASKSADSSLPDNVPIPGSRPDTSKTEVSAKAAAKSAPSSDRSAASSTSTTNNTSRSTTTSTGNRTSSGEDTSAAQAEASADISRCEQAASSANRCCNNPMACASASDRAYANRLNADPPLSEAGMPEYCRQMQALGDNSGGLNIRLGATCTNNHYACSNTCSSLETKYRSLMASCENCDSYSIYASTAATLASRSSSCSRLSAKADALSTQGLSTASNSAYGLYCQGLATAVPSATPSSADPTAGVSGFSNNYRAAGAPAVTAEAAARGDAGFKRADDSKYKQFNVGDTSGVQQTGYYGPGQQQQGDAHQVQVSQVANNSGGGIPQGDSGARLNANAGGRTAGYNGSRAQTTDVDQGFRSGGYSPPQNNEIFPMAYGQRPPPAERNTASNEIGGYKVGMDLKQYLPGGSRDPGRRMAGAAEQMQINAKEENIWRRISNKMYEKCKLGILWRCQ